MKPFQFRLERLKRVRSAQERAARADFGHVVYKNQFGEKVDKETWLKISDEKSYIIRDISDQRKNG